MGSAQNETVNTESPNLLWSLPGEAIYYAFFFLIGTFLLLTIPYWNISRKREKLLGIDESTFLSSINRGADSIARYGFSLACSILVAISVYLAVGKYEILYIAFATVLIIFVLERFLTSLSLGNNHLLTSRFYSRSFPLLFFMILPLVFAFVVSEKYLQIPEIISLLAGIAFAVFMRIGTSYLLNLVKNAVTSSPMDMSGTAQDELVIPNDQLAEIYKERLNANGLHTTQQVLNILDYDVISWMLNQGSEARATKQYLDKVILKHLVGDVYPYFKKNELGSISSFLSSANSLGLLNDEKELREALPRNDKQRSVNIIDDNLQNLIDIIAPRKFSDESYHSKVREIESMLNNDSLRSKPAARKSIIRSVARLVLTKIEHGDFTNQDRTSSILLGYFKNNKNASDFLDKIDDIRTFQERVEHITVITPTSKLPQTKVHIPKLRSTASINMVAELNNKFRETATADNIKFSSEVEKLQSPKRNLLLDKIRKSTRYYETDKKDRKSGIVRLKKEQFFWNILYYDQNGQLSSSDPSNPDKTKRALEISTRDEAGI